MIAVSPESNPITGKTISIPISIGQVTRYSHRAMPEIPSYIPQHRRVSHLGNDPLL